VNKNTKKRNQVKKVVGDLISLFISCYDWRIEWY